LNHPDQLSLELFPAEGAPGVTEPAATPTNDASGHSLFTKLWNVATHGVQQTKLICADAWSIITRPSEYALAHIDTDSENSLLHAVKFYATFFSIFFLLQTVAWKFEFVSGDSQVRTLSMLVFEIGLGLLFIFAIVRPFTPRLRLIGLLETILYVDGLYLIVITITFIPIAYYTYVVQTRLGSKPDIYNTAVEACFAQYSIIYSWLRGKVVFFLNDEHSFDGSYFATFLRCFNYIIAVPFAVIGAKMIKARYGVNLLLGIVAAICAFVISREVYDYLQNGLAASLVANSDCPDKITAEIIKDYTHYTPEILAPQIEVLMNNEFHDAGLKGLVRRSGENYTITQQVADGPITPEVRRNIVEQYTPWLPKAYCINNSPAFQLARSIDAKLTWTLVDSEGHILLSQVSSRDQCRVTTIRTEDAPVTPGPAIAEPTFPALTGRVVDDADLLAPADKEALTADLKALEAKTFDQVVVVTVPSLQGYAIERYGLKLSMHWGIGTKQPNNGVLLIVAPNEREARIEVGLGQTTLTDALSKTIIDNAILPRFQVGDFAGGIKDGVRDITLALTHQGAADGGEVPEFPGITPLGGPIPDSDARALQQMPYRPSPLTSSAQANH
jgi:hypothetical protein